MTTTPDPPSVIGDRVLAARKRLGLSREAVAFNSGLSWSAISQIETGRRPNPQADTLRALAGALRVTVDYLLGPDPQPRTLLNHHALIYEGRDDFASTAGQFVQAGIDAGEPTLVVTTRANRTVLRKHLGPGADRVRFEDSRRWYRSPRGAFCGFRDFAMKQLQAGAPWVWILGEPVWSGRSDSEISTWARYESLLNLAFAPLPLTVACPYDQAELAPEIIEHARATHCHSVVPGETSTNADYRDPAEFCLGQ